MKERPYLRTLITWAITAAIAFLGARYGIVIPPPPPLPAPAPPEPTMPHTPRQPDVSKAIGRIQFGRSGCTATPIGPAGHDGRYRIVTAAHCLTGEGQRGRFRAQDGSDIGVTVLSLDKAADCAWLMSDSTNIVLPFAELAETVPPPGTPVWHAGYGVDRPGNREDGVFVSGPDSNGQLKFRISVSSGDSGGAIVSGTDGRVVGVVCCTSGMARVADVWGAGPAAMRALWLRPAGDWEWIPLDIPTRMPKN